MSVQHSLKLLWELEQKHGGVIKGFLRREKNKRGKSSFHLPNGLSQLTDKIAASLSNKVQLNCGVLQIIKKSNGYEIDTCKGRVLCKQLVSTIPAYALKHLISDQSFIHVLEKVNYSPVDVFHFGFKKESIRNKSFLSGFSFSKNITFTKSRITIETKKFVYI